MSLRDDIRNAGRVVSRPCVVCEVLTQLDAADRKDLIECLDDPLLTGAAIARVLHDRGYPIHPEGKQVRRHRTRCVA